MGTDQIVESFRRHHAAGEFNPPEWAGKLDAHTAYKVQLGLLDARLAAGERQAGWKVGLTAPAMRELFGHDEPAFGHLMAAARHPSGQAFAWSTLRGPAIEAELMLVLGSDLAGPGVTPAAARAAIASVAPALELVELGRANMRADLALAIADNVAQRAFVHGTPVPLGDLEFGDVRARLESNGELIAELLGREVIDHQAQTLAWLANALHRHGRQLHAGDVVMSGSFIKPRPLAQGERFAATFAGIGSVSATFP